MDVCEVLARLGGTARADQLLRHVTARALAEAEGSGEILRLSRGSYGLTSAPLSHRAARRLNGTICGLSAAVEHGWEVLRQPERPWVSVPENRNVPSLQRRGVELLRCGTSGTVTSPLPTVLECSRRLSLPEALAVTDSALRSGTVDKDELVVAAAGVRGPGAPQARRVAAAATALAANPLESAIRGLSLTVPGLALSPQEPVEVDGITIHPDLLDRRLRLVVEAEGWLYHGGPEQFAHDLWRYTALTVERFTVVRFGHQAVTLRPTWVTECLESLVRTRENRLSCRSCA